jgi:hypothetical protein
VNKANTTASNTEKKNFFLYGFAKPNTLLSTAKSNELLDGLVAKPHNSLIANVPDRRQTYERCTSMISTDSC